MTPDEERLQRYLEWRRAGDRERAERRRRTFGYVAAPALCVLAVGLAAWLGRPSGARSPAVNAVTVPQPPATTPLPPSGATSLASEQPAVEPLQPAGRPQPRTVPPVASRPRLRPAPPSRPERDARVTAPAAPSDGAAGEPDVAAAVTSALVSPPSTPPRDDATERPEALPAEPREAPAEPTAPLPLDPVPAPPAAPSDVVALPSPPPPETAAQHPAPQESSPVAAPPSGGAVAVAPPTARQRAATWARGEVQEFHDGVKREIREFRTGYDKVRDFFRR